MEVYPNPITEDLFVKYISRVTGKQDMTLVITDITGKQMASFFIDKKDEVMKISLTSWGNGMYFYKLFTQDTVVENGKIIIVK